MRFFKKVFALIIPIEIENFSLILSIKCFRVLEGEKDNKTLNGSGEIRTRASEETGALNQRLRPLGHATFVYSWQNIEL